MQETCPYCHSTLEKDGDMHDSAYCGSCGFLIDADKLEQNETISVPAVSIETKRLEMHKDQSQRLLLENISRSGNGSIFQAETVAQTPHILSGPHEPIEQNNTAVTPTATHAHFMNWRVWQIAITFLLFAAGGGYFWYTTYAHSSIQQQSTQTYTTLPQIPAVTATSYTTTNLSPTANTLTVTPVIRQIQSAPLQQTTPVIHATATQLPTAVPSPTATQPAQPTPITFVTCSTPCASYNFSLTYPGNWTANALSTSTPGFAFVQNAQTAYVVEYFAGTTSSPDTLLHTVMQQFINSEMVGSPDTATIGGQVWNEQEIGYASSSGSPASQEAVLDAIVYQGNGYVIAQEATDNDFQSISSTYYLQMNQSFAFLNSANTTGAGK